MDDDADVDGDNEAYKQYAAVLSSRPKHAELLNVLKDIRQRLGIGSNAVRNSTSLHKFIDKYYARLLVLLINEIVVDWTQILDKDGSLELLNGIFVPISADESIKARLALLSLHTLIEKINSSKQGDLESLDMVTVKRRSPLLHAHIVHLISLLLKSFTLKHFYLAIAKTESSNRRTDKHGPMWTDFVRIYCSIPAKVANSLLTAPIPDDLHEREFFQNTCTSLVVWISLQSNQSADRHLLSAWSTLMTKLVRAGHAAMLADALLQSSVKSLLESSNPSTLSTIISSLASTDIEALCSQLLNVIYRKSLKCSNNVLSSEQLSLSKSLLLHISGDSTQARHCFQTHCIGASGIKMRNEWDVPVARVVVSVIHSFGQDGNSGEVHNMSLTFQPFLSPSIMVSVHGATSPLSAYPASLINNVGVIPTLLSLLIADLTMVLLLLLPRLDDAKLKSIRSAPELLNGIQAYMESYLPNASFNTTGNVDNRTIRDLGMLLAECVSEHATRRDPKSTVSPLKFGIQLLPAVEQLRILAKDSGVDAVYTQATIDDLFPAEAEQPVEMLHIPRPSTIIPKVSSPAPKPQPKRPEQKKVLIQEVTPDTDNDDDLKAYAIESEDESVASGDEGLDQRLHSKDKMLPPVYIRDLVEYFKSDSRDKIVLALEHADDLIRRKANNGTELQESAVDLTFTLIGLQDNFDLEHFDDKKEKALIGLVFSAPRQTVPCLSEQFFSAVYGVSQRYVMLTAIAIGARQLAGFDTTPQKLFPSRQLPAAQHERFVQAETLQQLTQHISNLTIAQTTSSSSSYNAYKEQASKYQVRQKKSANASEKQGANRLIGMEWEIFLGPLLGRWWNTWRDTAGDHAIFNPAILEKFINTLNIITYCCANSPQLRLIIREYWEFLLALRSHSHPSVQLSILHGVLCILCIFEASTAEASRILATEYTKELLETQEWADGLFEGVNDGADIASMRTTCAAVLVKISEIVEKHQRLLIGQML